jgi:TolA-binding protein
VPRAAVPAAAVPAEAPATPAVAPPVATQATPAAPAVTPEEMASPVPATVAERPAAARPAPAPRQTKIATREAAPTDGDTLGNLDEELRLVSAARAALKLGEGAAALQRLVEYQQRFPAGALMVEAQALRVDALCAAGDRAASAEAAEAFLTRWPESPLSARVRAACQ